MVYVASTFKYKKKFNGKKKTPIQSFFHLLIFSFLYIQSIICYNCVLIYFLIIMIFYYLCKKMNKFIVIHL